MPPNPPPAGHTATATAETCETADVLEEPPEPPSLHPSRAAHASAGHEQELLSQPLGVLGGMAIALLTLAVPLASVVLDRQESAPAGFPTSLQR